MSLKCQTGREQIAQVKGILKAELKRRNISYADLADMLAAIGVKDNERNIANKIARGSFTAVFLFTMSGGYWLPGTAAGGILADPSAVEVTVT
jgi:hypothetical protein